MARQVTALDDPKGLGVLRSYEIFDAQPELVFDRLAQLAAHICGTPYAAITVVDGTGSFYKATVGFTDDVLWWPHLSSSQASQCRRRSMRRSLGCSRSSTGVRGTDDSFHRMFLIRGLYRPSRRASHADRIFQ